ncbi:MAG TPA: ABC transporter substrate-binding protein [Acidimicrobiales bacterium]
MTIVAADTYNYWGEVKRGVGAGRFTIGCAALSLALVAAACGGDDGGSSGTTTSTAAPAATTTVATTAPASGSTTTAKPASDDPNVAFPTLGAPTGKQMVVGLVNTEGTPGLDFPDIRLAAAGTIDYLNKHGGIGGRPVKLETCVAKGSPETSQACAQELVGKKVELVMLGLDLFPDYNTYSAAGVPVIGMLPILPGDYTAKAYFMTGGNATSMAATAMVAKEHFKAETVGIVSADNLGANGTLAALEASLDKAGIKHKAVKGGDNETDAGYQGLMREAAKDNPDVLVSLYSDAGCIGTIRGRAALGITIPVITTGICSGAKVLDQVGDDAVGWNFVGVQTQEDTPALAILQEIMAPVLKLKPSEVDSTALGLGGLALPMVLSIAVIGNTLVEEKSEVTGQAVWDRLGKSDGLAYWPGNTPFDCGAATAYPAVCAFVFPVAEYKKGGDVVTVPGLEAISVLAYLP